MIVMHVKSAFLPIFGTQPKIRNSVRLSSVRHAQGTPCILKQGGLERSGQRLVSLPSQTKKRAFLLS